MSRVTAFESFSGLAMQTPGDIQVGEFDISAPQLDALAVEELYGITGYAKLAQVGIPVAATATGLERVDFHVFGVTNGAPFIGEATPNATGDGRAETGLPAGSIAIIDQSSLGELTRRASMSRTNLRDYCIL